jgi:chromosome segregation ATPase
MRAAAVTAAHDPFAQETIEILRAEVEGLQSELRQRDGLLAEQREASDVHFSAGEPDASTEELVRRLEELLDELQHSDERIAALEDFLRAADEANAAEREEREQLEAWVSDIERRISQREAEWQAEADAQRQRVADVTAERERLEQQLVLVSSAAGADDSRQLELDRLRARNKELQEKLAARETEAGQLKQQVQDLQHRASPEAQRVEMEDGMREERVRLAQQRAELARQRAEIAAARADLQQPPGKSPTGEPNVEDRMRALRDHLREIHDQEQEEQAQRGLSARIARLWKRLDGRG